MEVAKTDLHRYIELFYNRELSARLQAVSTLGYMSPVAIYNANGAKIYEYAYDAWGNMIRSTAAPGYMAQGNAANEVNPFRYRGYYYDTETGLYYLQSRYYNPEWGRFLNADAVLYGSVFGFNQYAYCDNNPVIKVDFGGMRGEEADYFDYSDPFDLFPESLEGGVGSSYHSYAIRNRTVAYDANFNGNYYGGGRSIYYNYSYYVVNSAITVTDDMVVEPPVVE